MRVTVIGAGAVGLGIASCLLQAKQEVRLVVRSEAQREALQRHGLRRTGIFGDVHFPADRFEMVASLAALAASGAGGDDFWLVCVKTTATRALADDLAPIWKALDASRHGPAPTIVLCQNGWGNAEIFAAQLPRESIWSGRVITGFERPNPASVDITVHADAIRLGSLFGEDLERIAPLCRAIDEGGVPCEPSREIERDLWAKLLYNSLLNPLGALVGVPYGVLGERDETRAIMAGVAHEIFDVLAASGHATHWANASDYLASFYERLLPPTARHESSMLQDLRAGRATEIDAICGAVCELARDHDLETPLNDALATLIQVAEKRTGGA